MNSSQQVQEGEGLALQEYNGEILTRKGTKESVRCKKWSFKYLDSLEIDQLMEDIKNLPGKKEKTDKTEKRPLYEKAQGVIVDETNQQIFVYLFDQLQYNSIRCYPYVREGTVAKWEGGPKGFDNCKKLYEDKENVRIFDFRELRRRQPEGEEHASMNNESLLQTKTKKKKQEKCQFLHNQMEGKKIAGATTATGDAGDPILDLIFDRILKKEKYDDLLKEYTDTRNLAFLTALATHREVLQAVERISKEETKYDEEIKEEEEKENNKKKEEEKKKKEKEERKKRAILQELQRSHFKFENPADYEEYKRGKSHLAELVEQHLLDQRAAHKLDKQGWNYYLVAEYAHLGYKCPQIVDTIKKEAELASEPKLQGFIKTLEKFTSGIPNDPDKVFGEMVPSRKGSRELRALLNKN